MSKLRRLWDRSWDMLRPSDEYKRRFRSASEADLNKAKILSDVVQIVISLSIAVYAHSYLLEQRTKSVDVFEIIVLIAGSGMILTFIVVMGFYLCSSISYFFLSEAAPFEHPALRLLAIFVSIGGSMAVMEAVYRLITALAAKSSAL